MTTRITPIRQSRTAVLLVGIVFAVTAVGALLAGVALVSAQTASSDLRIAARQLDNGKVEFALQVHDGESWGSRLLPQRRLFPADATVGRWLVSTPVDSTAGRARIAARQLDNGKVEFALQVHDGESWGSRLLPQRRLFPADATVGRWLVSTAVTTTAAAASGCYPYPAHVPQHTRDRLGCLPDDGTIRLFIAIQEPDARQDPEIPSIAENPDFRYYDQGRWAPAEGSRPLDIAVGTRIETYSIDRTRGLDKYMTVLTFNGTRPAPWRAGTVTNIDVCVHIYRWDIDPDRTPAYQRSLWVNERSDQNMRHHPDGQYGVGSFSIGLSTQGPCRHPGGDWP